MTHHLQAKVPIVSLQSSPSSHIFPMCTLFFTKQYLNIFFIFLVFFPIISSCVIIQIHYYISWHFTTTFQAQDLFLKIYLYWKHTFWMEYLFQIRLAVTLDLATLHHFSTNERSLAAAQRPSECRRWSETSTCSQAVTQMLEPPLSRLLLKPFTVWITSTDLFIPTVVCFWMKTTGKFI